MDQHHFKVFVTITYALPSTTGSPCPSATGDIPPCRTTIRRFSAEASTTLEAFKALLEETVVGRPEEATCVLSIAYKDSDGDTVEVTNEMEWREAVLHQLSSRRATAGPHEDAQASSLCLRSTPSSPLAFLAEFAMSTKTAQENTVTGVLNPVALDPAGPAANAADLPLASSPSARGPRSFSTSSSSGTSHYFDLSPTLETNDKAFPNLSSSPLLSSFAMVSAAHATDDEAVQRLTFNVAEDGEGKDEVGRGVVNEEHTATAATCAPMNDTVFLTMPTNTMDDFSSISSPESPFFPIQSKRADAVAPGEKTDTSDKNTILVVRGVELLTETDLKEDINDDRDDEEETRERDEGENGEMVLLGAADEGDDCLELDPMELGEGECTAEAMGNGECSSVQSVCEGCDTLPAPSEEGGSVAPTCENERSGVAAKTDSHADESHTPPTAANSSTDTLEPQPVTSSYQYPAATATSTTSASHVPPMRPRGLVGPFGWLSQAIRDLSLAEGWRSTSTATHTRDNGVDHPTRSPTESVLSRYYSTTGRTLREDVERLVAVCPGIPISALEAALIAHRGKIYEAANSLLDSCPAEDTADGSASAATHEMAEASEMVVAAEEDLCTSSTASIQEGSAEETTLASEEQRGEGGANGMVSLSSSGPAIPATYGEEDVAQQQQQEQQQDQLLLTRTNAFHFGSSNNASGSSISSIHNYGYSSSSSAPTGGMLFPAASGATSTPFACHSNSMRSSNNNNNNNNNNSDYRFPSHVQSGFGGNVAMSGLGVPSVFGGLMYAPAYAPVIPGGVNSVGYPPYYVGYPRGTRRV